MISDVLNYWFEVSDLSDLYWFFFFFFENPWVCFLCNLLGLPWAWSWACRALFCSVTFFFFFFQILVEFFFLGFFFFFCLRVEKINFFFNLRVFPILIEGVLFFFKVKKKNLVIIYNFFFSSQGVPRNTLTITWRRHCQCSKFQLVEKLQLCKGHAKIEEE